MITLPAPHDKRWFQKKTKKPSLPSSQAAQFTMTKEPYIDAKTARTQLWRAELTSATGNSHTIEGTRKFIIDAILKYLYPSGIRPLKER